MVSRYRNIYFAFFLGWVGLGWVCLALRMRLSWVWVISYITLYVGLRFVYIANASLTNAKCNLQNDPNANQTQVDDSIFTYLINCSHIHLNAYGNKGFIVF